MAEIPKRRTVDAGSLIPTVDSLYWKTEAEMLRHRLTLYQEFLKATGIVNSVWSQAEECRHLEYEIQCLAATIAKAGKSQDAEGYVQELIEKNMPRKPVEFDIWLLSHREFKERLHQADSTDPNQIKGSYRCYNPSCEHYVYGFASANNVLEHLKLHEQAQRAQLEHPRSHRRELSDPMSYRKSRETQDEGFDDAYDDDPDQSSQQDTERESHPGRILTGRTKQPRFAATTVPPLPSNRKRAAPGDVQTCLRCKILKKGCDSRSPCADCPVMDPNSSDYWKSLGCLHDMVKDLSERCVPSRMSTSTRKYNLDNGTVLPLYFAYTDVLDTEWVRGVEILCQYQEFRQLLDECWEDGQLRQRFMHDLSDANGSATNLVISGKQLAGHQTGLGLIKIGGYDSTYVEKTAYNPFTLFRISETVSRLSNLTPSDLLLNASHLLVTVTSIYRHEREVLDFINDKPYSHYRLGDGTENSPIRLPNIRRHLTEFLRTFDQLFSRRTILNAEAWLAAFYALCFFSIAKSLLIDTLIVRINGTAIGSGRGSEAIQIGAVYKVLVSSFMWSAKIKSWCPQFAKTMDPMLVDWTAAENGPKTPLSSTTREAFKETQAMIKTSKWADNSIKSTKEFLMNLGSGEFLDGRFSGFLVQRHGRKMHSFVPQPRLNALEGLQSDGISNSMITQVHEIPSAMDVDYPVGTLDGGMVLPMTAKTFDVPPRPTSRQRSVSRSSTYPQLSLGETSPPSEGQEPRKVRIYEQTQAPDLMRNSHDVWKNPSSVPEYSSRSDEQNYLIQPPPKDSGHRSRPVAEPPETHELDYTVAPGADYGALNALVDASGAAMRDQDASDTSRTFSPQIEDTPTIHGSISSRTSTGLSSDSPKMVPSRGLNRIIESQGDLRNIGHVARYTFTTDIRPMPSIVASNSAVHGPSSPQNNSLEIESGEVILQKGEKVVKMDVDSDRLRTIASKKPPRMETLTFRLTEGYDSPRSSRGPKTQEKRERTAKMRKIGACDDCRRRKVPCDPRHERPRKPSISSLKPSVPFVENDTEDAMVDIVFVYDFDSSSDSWSIGDGSLWPKELIAKDVSNSRIIIFGHSSLSSGLMSPTLEDRTLPNMAQRLAEELQSLRSSAVKQRRPILFVGHGYGGLIIKKALILHLALQESTVGVIFLGTPHSPLHVSSPPITTGKIDSRIPETQLGSTLFSMLQKGSMMLDSEREAFKTASTSIEIVCGYELRPTNGRIIVPESAAVLKTREIEVIAFDRDHVGLCRFPFREDEGYKQVLRAIRRLARVGQDRFEDV